MFLCSSTLTLFGDHLLTILRKVPYSVGVEHFNSAFWNLCVVMLLCKSEAINVLNVECQISNKEEVEACFGWFRWAFLYSLFTWTMHLLLTGLNYKSTRMIKWLTKISLKLLKIEYKHFDSTKVTKTLRYKHFLFFPTTWRDEQQWCISLFVTP